MVDRLVWPLTGWSLSPSVPQFFHWSVGSFLASLIGWSLGWLFIGLSLSRLVGGSLIVYWLVGRFVSLSVP